MAGAESPGIAELTYDLLYELHHRKLDQACETFGLLCARLEAGGDLGEAFWTLPCAGRRIPGNLS